MLLNINKPKGLTSHDVIDRVRRITGERRVGHGGTLDPFATGVLIVGVGRETTKKLSIFLKGTAKEYLAVLELGKTSSTYDPEGVIEKGGDVSSITKDSFEKILEEFEGESLQTPPPHSAIKIKGVPAYKLARKGIDPQIEPRKVNIESIELVDFQSPIATIRVRVSSGTYIRSLADDIGKRLGTGAYLLELTRTRVGEYKIEDSKTLKEIEDEINN